MRASAREWVSVDLSVQVENFVVSYLDHQAKVDEEVDDFSLNDTWHFGFGSVFEFEFKCQSRQREREREKKEPSQLFRWQEAVAISSSIEGREYREMRNLFYPDEDDLSSFNVCRWLRDEFSPLVIFVFSIHGVLNLAQSIDCHSSQNDRHISSLPAENKKWGSLLF